MQNYSSSTPVAVVYGLKLVRLNYYETYYIGTISSVQVWMNHVIPPVSVFVGIPAYLLIVLTFAVYDLGLSKQVRFYYIAIAAMDCVCIVAFHMFQYVGFEFRPVDTVLPLPFNNQAFCKLSRWLWYSSVQSSAFTTMMFAIDRYEKIRKPLWSKFKAFSRKMVVASAVGVGVLFCANGHIFASSTVFPIDVPPYGYCGISKTELGTIAGYILIVVNVTASSAEFVCNTMLLFTLKRIAQLRLRTFEQDSTSAMASGSVTATAITVLVHGFIHAAVNIIASVLLASMYIIMASRGSLHVFLVLYNLVMIFTYFIPAFVVMSTFAIYTAKLNGFRRAILHLVSCHLVGLKAVNRHDSFQSS